MVSQPAFLVSRDHCLRVGLRSLIGEEREETVTCVVLQVKASKSLHALLF